MQALFGDSDLAQNLLIVGRQVKNEFGGECDLVAIDSEGAIVIIEIKRDPKDCKARVEAFEMQAIRYASSFTRIESPEELATQVFSPYLQKYSKEEIAGKDVHDYATMKIKGFLGNCVTFNQTQKIVLIASGFDPETMSGCAWLRKNGIDITCVKISPLVHSEQKFLLIETILPPPELDDMLANVGKAKTPRSVSNGNSPRVGRARFMTTAEMVERGLLNKGDTVYVKGHPNSTAEIQDHRTVLYNGKAKSLNEWAKDITTWSAVNIYANVMKGNQTLDEIRNAAQPILDQEGGRLETD